MIDLENLNPQQRDAVTHGTGPLLVLAGAGSGKTRVITYRIAWLLGHMRVDPSSILAVTFTNKAADEMLSRVDRLVPGGGRRPWIGTFHSISLRILRRHADRLGYTRSFTIYDAADQLTLVRRSLRELSMSEDAFQPRAVLGRISRAKNELVGPSEFERDNRDFFGSRIAEVYKLYQRKLREFDAMDFDDLISRHIELLQKHPDARDEIRRRAQYLLIDEYQDTNRAQYVLIRELAGETGNITAVGDEDQSIYRFRGADINNILNFERDFPGARIIKLEQNYRSTGNILDAATGVVSNNKARKGKTLYTDAGEGEPVRVVTCDTEREEARFVLDRIRELSERGMPLAQMAVLFRMNAQSRPFEEELLNANLPYSVVGGVKFYERAEIKDVLSFLRLAVRPEDTPSIQRVINVPSRGIGSTTVEALEAKASEEGVSLWALIEGDLRFLPERARKAVAEFREIAHDLQKAAANPLPDFIDFVLLRTGYRRLYAESKDPQDESRLQNVDELVSSAREFWETNPGAALSDYLDSITLMSDVDRYDNQKGVTLMTLHAAKGLEFDVVFLAGMEEGILPHSQSRGEQDDIEEERRLCYVGMTRARKRLYCIRCYQRRLHGQFREQAASPFLDEIPERVRQEVRLAGAVHGRSAQPSWRERPLERREGRPYGRAAAAPPAGDSANSVVSFFGKSPVQFDPAALRSAGGGEGRQRELTRGARVRHEEFGEGVILRMEGSGDNAKLTVYFDRAGSKKFIAKYAKLQRI